MNTIIIKKGIIQKSVVAVLLLAQCSEAWADLTPQQQIICHAEGGLLDNTEKRNQQCVLPNGLALSEWEYFGSDADFRQVLLALKNMSIEDADRINTKNQLNFKRLQRKDSRLRTECY